MWSGREAGSALVDFFLVCQNHLQHMPALIGQGLDRKCRGRPHAADAPGLLLKPRAVINAYYC